MKRHTRSLIHITESLTPEPTFGAEVGCWDGQNAEQLLRHFDHLYLAMVDRFEELTAAERTEDPRMGAKLAPDMQYAMQDAWCRTKFASDRRSIIRADSSAAAKLIEPDTMDFVFIDAHHAYWSVRADIGAWWPRVRHGGLLCGHDYEGRGDRIGRFGVKRAVDEFAAEHGYTVAVEPGNVWWIQMRGKEDVEP